MSTAKFMTHRTATNEMIQNDDLGRMLEGAVIRDTPSMRRGIPRTIRTADVNADFQNEEGLTSAKEWSASH